MTSSAELMNKGMQCLINEMGVVNAEEFILLISREKFDYTRWQREYFDKKTPSDISAEAGVHEKENPFTGTATIL